MSDAPNPDPVFDPNGGMPRLLEIMRRLRDPETGCPWDIEQDFASIAPYTIEEAYEVADAIEREAWDELKGELGDLLLQTVYHAQMADEAGLFGFDAVADAISDKMVDRHPHVFGTDSRDNLAIGAVFWQQEIVKTRLLLRQRPIAPIVFQAGDARMDDLNALVTRPALQCRRVRNDRLRHPFKERGPSRRLGRIAWNL